MLSEKTRLRLQEILSRLASNQHVGLNERIDLHKFADNDQTVASWLDMAQRQKNNLESKDSLDNLLDDLNLGSPDPESTFRPNDDDLGEWFSGAPTWLGRS